MVFFCALRLLAPMRLPHLCACLPAWPPACLPACLPARLPARPPGPHRHRFDTFCAGMREYFTQIHNALSLAHETEQGLLLEVARNDLDTLIVVKLHIEATKVRDPEMQLFFQRTAAELKFLEELPSTEVVPGVQVNKVTHVYKCMYVCLLHVCVGV